MQVQLPQRLHFISRNNQMLGYKNHSFGFLDIVHADIIIKRIHRNKYIKVFHTPLKPNVYSITGSLEGNAANFHISDVCILSLDKDEYVNEFLENKMSIRLITDVTSDTNDLYKLSASLEIGQMSNDDIIFLERMFHK
jgi:hypothetical protein